MATEINGGVGSTVKAGVTPGVTDAVTRKGIASNFDTFLQLLTTQLRNQNPLDPLDTNQFTQQLVQFAQVEQQLRQNEQLETLVSMEKSAQSTLALGFVGATVAVDGSRAALGEDVAAWSLTTTKPAAATVNIKDMTGKTVYTSNLTLNPGRSDFLWDGRGNDGTQYPKGNYTMAITAKDTAGQPVAVSTEIEGVVDFVDLTKTPPVLSIAAQDYTVDKIKRLVRPR